jgi:hypothetical protein
VDGADGTGAVAGQGTLSAAVGADSRRQGDAPLPIPLLILEALAILSVCGAVFVIAKLRRALGRGGFGEARIGRGRIGDDRFGKGGVAA